MYEAGIYDLFFVAGAIIGMLQFHVPTRQRMMIMKVIAGLFIALYFNGVGAETAMMAVCISALGGVMQASFPDHLLRKTRLLRAGGAALFAGISIMMAASNTLEALPLIATICSRFNEVQACQQRMRMGYVVSQILWIIYTASTGLILIYIITNLSLLSNLNAIWTHEQKCKKLVAVPVRAA